MRPRSPQIEELLVWRASVCWFSGLLHGGSTWACKGQKAKARSRPMLLHAWQSRHLPKGLQAHCNLPCGCMMRAPSAPRLYGPSSSGLPPCRW